MSERRRAGVDFTPFENPQLQWEDRRRAIHREFPSTAGMDWLRAFDQDIDMLGHLLRDILKAEVAIPGRPGPRPGLDRHQVQPQLDAWMGRDPAARPYSTRPFPEAFGVLSRWQRSSFVEPGEGRSLATIARKVGIPRSQTYRLLKGVLEPTFAQMEQVAAVYGKAPSYFLEYRVGAITGTVMESLANSPEQSIRYYEALHQAAAR